jgi:hypothetical protein|tara:strand:+ start:657 stop:818 length:162 start_codon:yes stop_codon:yes gene_type:complete
MNTQQLLLETILVKELNKVIKKQNDEIDMLIKQKKFLQKKLREKAKNDKKSND